MGGLSRRNTAIDLERAKSPTVVVDVGGSLLKSGGADGSAGPQNRLKATLVAEALALGGVDVMTLSSSDWQLGRETVFGLVNTFSLPVIAANLRCADKSPFEGFKGLVSAGKRIGFVGVTAGQIEGCVLMDPYSPCPRP
jgi:2',3'-cyclic-nucleotide 2'-phosphodiesterase (5'-nucleotidase family)